jgi:hypothetical protein
MAPKDFGMRAARSAAKSVAFTMMSLIGSDFEAHHTAVCARDSMQLEPRGPQFRMTIYCGKYDHFFSFLSTLSSQTA